MYKRQAVIRELFEETGILLARDSAGTWAPDAESFGSARQEVDAGELKWPAFLEEHGLEMACDALHYFAFWVTPVVLPKRWSTRFFLAALPPGQQAVHDGKELTDSRWLTARQALDEQQQGRLKLPHPTIRSLEQLVVHDSIGAMHKWADRLASEGVPRFTSVRREVDGSTVWLDPWDPDYPGDDGT